MRGYKEPIKTLSDTHKRVEFTDTVAFFESRAAASHSYPDLKMSFTDRLEDTIRDWPRGKGKLTLSVEREPEKTITFTPATIGLYPTQLYETVSMVLLILFLLAYYPYRRHDGQLMTLLMMGYAFHRFVNESLRIEPAVGNGLTLSQWGSVLIFAAAVLMEIYLWRTMPSRWSSGTAQSPLPAPAPAPGA
jgi:phosphatidylglycerol---prolipoprotein diacylglyceryl transferase